MFIKIRYFFTKFKLCLLIHHQTKQTFQDQSWLVRSNYCKNISERKYRHLLAYANPKCLGVGSTFRQIRVNLFE